MESQNFFQKHKKLILIGVIGLLGVIVFVIVSIVSLNNQKEVNFPAFSFDNSVPDNTCPDALVNLTGKAEAILNGKTYDVSEADYKYIDTNCRHLVQSTNVPVDSNRGPNYSALPTCEDGNAYFDKLPAAASAFSAITPLGSINVPDHTIPTDHVYFALKRTAEDFSGRPIPTTLWAPGDIVITGISNTAETKNGILLSDDYGLEFAACRGAMHYFGHIKVINNPKLKVELQSGMNCNSGSPATGTEIKNCIKTIDIKLSSGEEIGIVGDNSIGIGFDLGSYNFTKKQQFINQTIYPSKTSFALCPFDYYSDSVKAEAYRLLNRTQEPLCGNIMQDLPGTLQGEWFFGDSTKNETYLNWDNHLSFVHDNVDPAIGVVAIASTLSGPKMLMFTPTHSGNINRELSEIKPSDTVYCFSSEQTKAAHRYVTGSVLVRLKSETRLDLQWQDGDCSSITMTSPKEYQR